MIELTLIGIGTGSLGHLTREAIAAMNEADLILIPGKGADKADLADLRRALCAEVLTHPVPLADFDMPVRDASHGYQEGVSAWHDEIALRWQSTIRAHQAQRPALLIWGDPMLYDSSLRIAERIARDQPLGLRVIPGITAIQALCAGHAIPLNGVGAPVTITTGRQLRDHGWPPEGADRIIVMLDGGCAFQTLNPDAIRIWWGAFLGMAQQMLFKGDLRDVGPRIISERAAARQRHGWIMDIYLLERDAPQAPKR